MRSRLAILIELLHTPGEIALATNSLAMPGYPYSTTVAFATDEHHCPVVLISRLAEHTRDIAADSRVSLSVAKSLGDGEITRASMIGHLLPIDADPGLERRYLRFHPAAERFLRLGDFRFHRFEPERVRVVGGFGQAGWLDARQLLDAPHLSLDEEAGLIEKSASALPDGVSLLGLDAYGADAVIRGNRGRIGFRDGPVAGEAVVTALSIELKA